MKMRKITSLTGFSSDVGEGVAAGLLKKANRPLLFLRDDADN